MSFEEFVVSVFAISDFEHVHHEGREEEEEGGATSLLAVGRVGYASVGL